MVEGADILKFKNYASSCNVYVEINEEKNAKRRVDLGEEDDYRPC